MMAFWYEITQLIHVVVNKINILMWSVFKMTASRSRNTDIFLRFYKKKVTLLIHVAGNKINILMSSLFEMIASMSRHTDLFLLSVMPVACKVWGHAYKA